MNPPKGKLAYPRRFNDGFDYRKNNLIICTMQERQQLLPFVTGQFGFSDVGRVQHGLGGEQLHARQLS